MSRARVLLVDDHPLFRSGVAALLRMHPDFDVIGEASSGEEAVARALELRPDVILMDQYMPGITGVEATRRIATVLPETRILMLTFSEEDEDLFEAIKAGACGYILKKVGVDTLIASVRGAFLRDTDLTHRTAGMILREFTRLADRSGTGPDPSHRLSPREHDVLVCLSRGATNKEIAAALTISENTVKNHLKRILEKLHVENRVQAAAYAVHNGIGRPAAS